MPSHADLVFTGGPVFTAVGHDEVRALIGPRTEVVDLAGRLLVPGFQDAHVHAVFGGVELGECDLSGTIDLAEYQRRIHAYAKAHPDREWITGGGWSMESFPGGTPTRQLLDALVPDRPAYLVNRDHHGAWANTRALQLAGLTAATMDPADGRIEREADGTPGGMLQEGAAGLVAHLVPPTTPAQRLAGLLRAQELSRPPATRPAGRLRCAGPAKPDSPVAPQAAVALLGQPPRVVQQGAHGLPDFAQRPCLPGALSPQPHKCGQPLLDRLPDQRPPGASRSPMTYQFTGLSVKAPFSL